MIVTKVLVLIVLIVILCIVSFLIKKNEQFSADIPFNGKHYDPNVIKEINELNKIILNKNIGNEKVKNKAAAVARIQELSVDIDGKMEQLMKIRDLLQMLPTCREIDLVPNSATDKIEEGYSPAELDNECSKHNNKNDCYFKGAQGEKYCVWDKAKIVVIGNGDPKKKRWADCDDNEKEDWKEDIDGYRCQLRKLNPKCDKIKKLNGETPPQFVYDPYIVPNAFENF